MILIGMEASERRIDGEEAWRREGQGKGKGREGGERGRRVRKGNMRRVAGGVGEGRRGGGRKKREREKERDEM
jgi:hypothetical protein